MSIQYAVVTLSAILSLTPTLQYLKDPALNPVNDSLWVFGLRAWIAL